MATAGGDTFRNVVKSSDIGLILSPRQESFTKYEFPQLKILLRPSKNPVRVQTPGWLERSSRCLKLFRAVS
jgi:hypothetical protein